MIGKKLEWTDEMVAKFWDYESQFPDKYFTKTFGGRIVEEVAEFIDGKKEILDYGTGIGMLMPHLLNKGVNVTGTDFSRDSINIVENKFNLNKNFLGVYYIDDILKLEKKFDVIFCVEMIEHINDHYLDVTMKNFQHLLSDDGVIVITTPNDEKLDDNNIYCPNCESIFHRWQHIRSWSEESIKTCVNSFGFKEERIFTTFFERKQTEQPLPFTGKLAKFIRKNILGRKESHANQSRGKAPHLVAVIRK